MAQFHRAVGAALLRVSAITVSDVIVALNSALSGCVK